MSRHVAVLSERLYRVDDPDLSAAIDEIVAALPARGLERWHTVVLFELAGGARLHLVARAGALRGYAGGHPAPRTVVAATPEALAEVFFTARDITHQFAQGTMRLVSGDYYDAIFLSRALRRRGADRGGPA